MLLLLHLGSWLTLALGLAAPRCRTWAIVALAATALAGVITAGFADGNRTLTTVHTFAGFEGAAMEASMVAFPTGSFTAPAWHWPMVFLGFAGLWIAVLWVLGRAPLRNPLLLPLLFAWTGIATWLGMQWCAAPEILVQPVGLDRFLWPAGLAAALLAARRAATFGRLFLWLSAATLLMRLPAALFSKFATDQRLGTCLDVHDVRDIINPLTQMQFEPRLQVDSGEQQFWLIWLEHVIFFPAVHLMGLFGVAFAAWMFHRHPDSRGAG
ncbi:MAG: hypothetical protein WBO45_17785 [Planctomycetota bacterium]